MADNDSDDTPGSGRRGGERRKQQLPFEGPDRRKAPRRSGEDRRADPRSEGTLEEGT
jgi:hypothetical protein